MFADRLNIVNNEAQTYSEEFYELMTIMMPKLDVRIPFRERIQIVIMEYLRLTFKPVPNTESIKALSLAATMAESNFRKKLKAGMLVADIIPPTSIDESGRVYE
jgi:hypothetical protein